MNETVFADSFFYLALLNPRDVFHQRMREWASSFRGTAVTTEAVLLELGDAFCEPGQRQVLLRLIEEVRKDQSIEVVPLSAELVRRAWRLFEERGDKDWGITDCISFTVMADKRITEALTGDRHFTQAGFRAMFAD